MIESKMIQEMQKDVERATNLVCPKCNHLMSLMISLPQRMSLYIDNGIGFSYSRVENPVDPPNNWWLECRTCHDTKRSPELPEWINNEIVAIVETDCRINRNYRD